MANHPPKSLYRIAKKGVKDPYGLQTNIIGAFSNSVICRQAPWRCPEERLQVCRFYVQTVTENIALFLKDKPHHMSMRIEEAQHLLPSFWEQIGAQGDLDAATRELAYKYNA